MFASLIVKNVNLSHFYLHYFVANTGSHVRIKIKYFFRNFELELQEIILVLSIRMDMIQKKVVFVFWNVNYIQHCIYIVLGIPVSKRYTNIC
jgi:hypothetical protein